jgi:hypothetical protein
MSGYQCTISDLDECINIAKEMFVMDVADDNTYVDIRNSLQFLVNFDIILRAYLQAYIETPNIPNENTNKRYSAPVFDALDNLRLYLSTYPRKTIADAPFSTFKFAYENFRDMQRVPNRTYTFGSI